MWIMSIDSASGVVWLARLSGVAIVTGACCLDAHLVTGPAVHADYYPWGCLGDGRPGAGRKGGRGSAREQSTSQGVPKVCLGASGPWSNIEWP